MIDEDPEEPVFSAAQGHGRALPVEQVTAHRVEAPLTKGQELPGLADLEIGRQHPRAAQDGFDPRKKFTGSEGLRQIVVGAHFEPDNAIHLVIAGGQHQDWRGFVFPRPQLTA
ncbi:hypothetical protein D3C80_1067870 [compost metagenome]